MTAASIRDSTTVVVAAGVLSREFEGEFVILNLDSGVYFGLDQAGARIWALLQEPVKVGAIGEHIATAYDVDRTRSDRDLQALLQDLVARGLVEIVESPEK